MRPNYCFRFLFLLMLATGLFFLRPTLSQTRIGPVIRDGPSSASTSLTRSSVEEEIRRRAKYYLAQKQLVVDYYRIGRCLAFPLELKRIVLPGLPIPGIPDYPWEIWLSWEIEEKLNSLGWAAEWFSDQSAVAAASRELEALSEWPEFTPNHRLDLCLGHTARTLWEAYSQWTWLEPRRRDSMGKAMDRLVAQAKPWVEDRYGNFQSADDILKTADPYSKVHNIPFIGLIGVALAANARHDAAAPALNDRVKTLIEVLMVLRQQGYTEGVAYDGYLLDFVACWLQSLPAAAREQMMRQFDFNGFLNESYRLGAPGEIVQVAEIGDVEPRRMPFHISAQARIEQLQPNPIRAWYLSRCRPELLRSDGLASLHSLSATWDQTPPMPAGGLLDAQYAKVLRSGWDAGDLAVAVAAGNSPAGHIHFDFGSITIGTSNRWIIADPGYQQYMPGEEREFTLGPAAHNAPVLNGKAQEIKAGRVIAQGEKDKGIYWVKLDLTGCYPQELEVTQVSRSIFLYRDRLVVLADQLKGPKITELSYHWHGCPEAAWRVQDGWALLYTGTSTLWFTSPGFAISDSNLDRLPGSRGQLTLKAGGKARPIVWWIFSRSESPPSVEPGPEGQWIETLGQRFSVE